MMRPLIIFAVGALILAGGYPVEADIQSGPVVSAGRPQVVAPTRPRTVVKRYPWRKKIKTTVFWIGERPTRANPTPNFKSSWDVNWTANYGGYDDPNPKNRVGYRPKGFLPQQNPFYIALPFNDVAKGARTKPIASRAVPWFKKRYRRQGKTVLKGQWIAIRYRNRICYAQWEDVGPWETDDWPYVFGTARPKSPRAGLDVSPAVRDYLKLRSGDYCDWRFVSLSEVQAGPWRYFGANNPFARSRVETAEQRKRRYDQLRKARDRATGSLR
ncbi:MAG: hypothetical protein AAF514_07345 [Verrucomicrobiota bacterium]